VDWIEKLFGVSPDGGDGSTELGLALALAGMIIAVVATMAFVRHTRARQGAQVAKRFRQP
jgi:hypothetical protein